MIALYLKRLDRALADGDRIHGVVVHTVVNNDGGGDTLVTPNPVAQEALLRAAYRDSGVPADAVAYVEAHGAGTRRGDPIEASAIGRVLGAGRTGGPLPIGSVKTNIGHLEPAAGLAGLVKVLLALRHRLVPPSLHSADLNPDIDFDGLNLRVVQDPWPLPDGPLYAGINSFGWGGTNAHAIVAPAPLPVPVAPAAARVPVLLPVSAHRLDALRERVAQLAPVMSTMELVGTAGALARHHRTVFVFPGQGSQWSGMGARLYAEDEVFAAAVRRCAQALRPHVDWDPVTVVSGAAGDGWLDRLDMVQPLLWVMSVALAETWRAHGIEPDVVVGHSQGEVSAAAVAGILSLEDAALVVATRSRLVARTAGRGGMLAVELDPDEATDLVGGRDDVSLAASNGPRSCVLSGDVDALAGFREKLEADGVYCRTVNVDYAAHSPQMDALSDEMVRTLAPVRPRTGTVASMSTVDVERVDGGALDARYWMRNLRQPVLFADAMDAHDNPARVLFTLRRDGGTARDFTHALAAAYVAGLAPFALLPSAPVALPPYPWQRSRFWVPDGRRRAAPARSECPVLPAAGEQGVWWGTTRLDLDEQPWLADHRVYEAVAVPGVAMLALGLSAARSRLGDLPDVVEDVRFHADLTLGGEPVVVGVQWRDDDTGCGTVTLRSLVDDSTAWTTHATARMRRRPAAEPGATPFPAGLSAAPARDIAAFYLACGERGLNYGPALQTVVALHGPDHGGPRAALAQVVLGRRAGAWSGLPHPVLWDGALQPILALCDGAPAMVPTAVRRITMHAQPAEPIVSLWSYALRRDEVHFDVFLYDAERQPLMTIEGLTLQPVAAAPPDDRDGDRLYRMRFHRATRDEPAPLGGAVAGARRPGPGREAVRRADGGRCHHSGH